jgi:hypothetical protein
MRIVAIGCALALVVVGVASFVGSARASGSAPTLALTGADTFATQAGGRAVVVTGSFNFDDRLQFSFPVGLLVVQGDRFARYDVSGEIVSASSALVADGVVATEIPDLLAITGAAAAPAALVQIRPHDITVALPPDFVSGSAIVLLYASRDSESFVSNAVSVVLP